MSIGLVYASSNVDEDRFSIREKEHRGTFELDGEVDYLTAKVIMSGNNIKEDRWQSRGNVIVRWRDDEGDKNRLSFRFRSLDEAEVSISGDTFTVEQEARVSLNRERSYVDMVYEIDAGADTVTFSFEVEGKDFELTLDI